MANIKKQAAKLILSNQISEVWVNSKGEFFSDKNRAELSEKDAKKRKEIVNYKKQNLTAEIAILAKEAEEQAVLEEIEKEETTKK